MCNSISSKKRGSYCKDKTNADTSVRAGVKAWLWPLSLGRMDFKLQLALVALVKLSWLPASETWQTEKAYVSAENFQK